MIKKYLLKHKTIYIKINRIRKKVVLRIRSFLKKPKEKPIIILGNQKSGTTAIAALLAKYIKKNVTLDMLPICNEIDRLILQESRFEDFVNKYSILFSTQIIKEPWLTFIPSQVFLRFPKAKYILIIRDPRDNIRSILDRLKITGNKKKNPDEIKSLRPGWKQVFMPELYNWDYDNYIEILANRWNYATNIDQYIKSKELVIVRYEDFMNNKTYTIRKLAQKIGEAGKGNISDLLTKQFQPKGKSRNITWKDFYGEENLHKIEKICEDNMRRYNYKK